MARRTTIVENIAHPDHDGVVGDLVRNTETGQYYLLEYVPDKDRYVTHSVPYTWARKQDPHPDERGPQRVGVRPSYETWRSLS